MSIYITIGYSVRVVSNSTPITPGFGNSTTGKDTSKLGTGQGILTDLDNGLPAVSSLLTFFSYIPSLSCSDAIVTSCDQDTGNIGPIDVYLDSAIYCLVVTNPYTNAQTIDVAFSGNGTVFEFGGYTSHYVPDVPSYVPNVPNVPSYVPNEAPSYVPNSVPSGDVPNSANNVPNVPDGITSSAATISTNIYLLFTYLILFFFI